MQVVHDGSAGLVTAVVTTHNRRELVKKAIHSVLRQTYPDMELIVVDDASEDGTREELSEYAEREGFLYIYIRPEESKGGNYARNLGIRHSHGKYIAFLDDDDEWLDTKIERQVGFLENHPDYGVVSCLRIFEYDMERIEYQEDVNILEGDIHHLIFTEIPSVTSTILIRKECLEQCGYFDENLKFWQEYELSIRYAQITKVGCVHEHLCLYRVIRSDRNRLTNKLDGWVDTVRYIDDKHKELIDKLPRDHYRKKQLYVAGEGIQRAITVGDSRQGRCFLKTYFRYDPTPKNFIKIILGINGITRLKAIYQRISGERPET